MYSYSGLVDLWFSFYRVVPLPDGDGVDYEYTKFECTCRSFCRYCCCKHAYAEGLRTGEMQMPPEADQAWFDSRKGHRPPGRPTKMKDRYGEEKCTKGNKGKGKAASK